MRNLTTQASKLMALACVALAATAARAEVTANIAKVHLCCKGCVTILEKAVAEVEGAKAVATPKEGKPQGDVKVTADNVETLQKAIDAIADAGFHGRIDNKEVKFKPVKLGKGKAKVQRIELAHIHNCCPMCTKAIKAAIGKVEGVTGDTVEAKKDKFVVEGDFDAKAVVKALNKAGFHASLPKEEKEKTKS
jgi:periplasmic mercuric ion binding protein